MCSLEPFKIDLKGLEDGLTRLNLSLDDTFFAAIEAEEVRQGHADVELTIQRTAERYFELHFHITGEVTVQCDRCLDDMPQAVDAEHTLAVKFGEEYSEDDDLVTVAEDDGVLDTAWFIYEIIVLNIPIKHVHAPGKCNRAMIDMLEEHSAARSSDGVEGHEIAPRWSGLLKLKDLKE
ncbi:MAG: DUF177 domain-containing protein [Prevotella sp.]|nr:DUF177 domain-containing protein [Prevotella sp.]